MKLHVAGILVVVAVMASLAVRPAAADIITLAEGSSTLRFDTASEALHYDWVVAGRDYLQQQGFWYRIDGQPGGENPLRELAAPTVFIMDSNEDGLDDYLRLTYAGAGLKIEVSYTLVAGGTRSDVSEGIRITNTGSTASVVHFFQYADFDLAGPGGEDTIWIHNGNTATQTVVGSALLGETIDSPAPNHLQAGLGGAVLGLLTDSFPTTLDGTTGPLTGNAEWAFQWDFTIQPGAAIPIVKDKTLVVPEPATLAMLAGGLAMGLLLRRKK